MNFAEYGTAADLGPNVLELRDGQEADDLWPDPMPLVRPLGDPSPFPVEALGPVLENAAKGINDIVQCPLALAGNSVLAAASFAAQAHVNVIFPATGRSIPTSLFFLTVGESGERKSAADAEALAAVREREKVLAEEYRETTFRHRSAMEAREATRAAIKKTAKGGDWLALQDKLSAMGDDPIPPRKPFLIVTEPTTEGLAKLYVEGQPSLGLFSAEGGSFIGGHAMKDESRLRALTGLSELWDGSPLRRTRAGDGSMHLEGRRLSLHLMVQPNVAPMLLADDMASGQGFLSRLLVCAPASTQGSRFQRAPQPWARGSIDECNRRIGELLSQRPRLLADGGVDPEALSLTEAATVRWCNFADDMERELLADGLGSSIRGLRNKTPEMALRLAGVLASVEGETQVSPALLDRGIALARYYLSEAGRLYAATAVKPEIGRAMKLLRWLVERNCPTVSARDIQQFGPAALREWSAVHETLATLEAHNLVRVESSGKRGKRVVLSPLAEGAM
jgi:hypothetical protein